MRVFALAFDGVGRREIGMAEIGPVLPPDEAEDYYYRGEVVVLDDLIRQEVILAVPFSPQCKADCRGLCPQCGTDLNLGACGCAPPPDPRWKALREHLKK